LRAHEQQAAQDLDQWKTRSVHEERKTFDATQAAITLAMLFTTAQFEELEEKALELEQRKTKETT
jgi:hypothetical protein